ncbi:hypothetical protein C8R46DRAFT_1289612 [Mycena filopes]|nr:hypothetical protein C8R46DRAFT_1289612 [Mycena filopes]
MDPAQLQSIIVDLENVVITRYVSAAGYVLLLYDHLLTLSDEVEFIWSAPTTVAKVLFLIMRYMVPLFLTGETITRSGLAIVPMSDLVSVSGIFPLLVQALSDSSQMQDVELSRGNQTYAGWLSIAISNFLVLLRIWTTLPRGHRFVVYSIVFFIIMQLVNFGVTTWVITQMIPVFVFEPFVGLCTFTTKPSVVGLWVPGLVFEVVVFACVCWNVLRAAGLGSADPEASMTSITRVFFRDGLVYFVILTALRVSNAVLAVTAPISSLFVIVYFIWAGVTLTTSRLIINSRREMGRAARRALLLVPADSEGCENLNGSRVRDGDGETDTLELELVSRTAGDSASLHRDHPP